MKNYAIAGAAISSVGVIAMTVFGELLYGCFVTVAGLMPFIASLPKDDL